MHVIAAKAIAMKVALTEEFKIASVVPSRAARILLCGASATTQRTRARCRSPAKYRRTGPLISALKPESSNGGT